MVLPMLLGQNDVVGIATRYELNGPGTIPMGARLSAPVQTGPGADPASYTMGTGDKVAGAWRWPRTPI